MCCESMYRTSANSVSFKRTFVRGVKPCPVMLTTLPSVRYALPGLIESIEGPGATTTDPGLAVIGYTAPDGSSSRSPAPRNPMGNVVPSGAVTGTRADTVRNGASRSVPNVAAGETMDTVRELPCATATPSASFPGLNSAIPAKPPKSNPKSPVEIGFGSVRATCTWAVPPAGACTLRMPSSTPATNGRAAEAATGKAAGSATGKAAGSATSKAAGSATGKAAGSAAGKAAGSATGKAAGSATGKAAGSATGKAAGSATGKAACAANGKAARTATGASASAATAALMRMTAGILFISLSIRRGGFPDSRWARL